MKVCTICKEHKDLSEFNRKKSSKDGLQPHCRDCNKERSRAYYARNREAHKKETRRRSKIYQKANSLRACAYLVEHGCVDCGWREHPAGLDFDHIDPATKTSSISSAIASGWSWKRIAAEIAKCEVRCARCHRVKTAEEWGWYKFPGV